MCLDCGCGLPDERHGDNRHITMEDLVAAADANGANASKVLTNIQTTAQAVLDGQLESKAIQPSQGTSQDGAPA